mgnify:CR=1 FL=1
MAVSILSRYCNIRTLGLVLLYALLCGLSYFVAYQLRFDFNVPESHALDLINTIWWVVVLKLMLLVASGQMDCVLSYFRLPDAVRLSLGLFVTSCILASMWYVYDGNGVPPRAVILTDFLLSFFLGMIDVGDLPGIVKVIEESMSPGEKKTKASKSKAHLNGMK